MKEAPGAREPCVWLPRETAYNNIKHKNDANQAKNIISTTQPPPFLVFEAIRRKKIPEP